MQSGQGNDPMNEVRISNEFEHNVNLLLRLCLLLKNKNPDDYAQFFSDHQNHFGLMIDPKLYQVLSHMLGIAVCEPEGNIFWKNIFDQLSPKCVLVILTTKDRNGTLPLSNAVLHKAESIFKIALDKLDENSIHTVLTTMDEHGRLALPILGYKMDITYIRLLSDRLHDSPVLLSSLLLKMDGWNRSVMSVASEEIRQEILKMISADAQNMVRKEMNANNTTRIDQSASISP